MYRRLFQPIQIAGMRVPNRIAMTAMGNHLANPDGSVSDADVAFYAARAAGGVGLVITECACVDFAAGKGNLRQLAVDDDRFIPGLKRLADAVHAHGAALCVQLYHPGRQGIAAVNGVETMAAPSVTECQCVHQPTHAMAIEEIREMVHRFAMGAYRLKQAGVDAVEFHGAHGYLIGQFLSPYTNRRSDAYGGSFENRMRFLDEIILEARRLCGDYPMLVRFSVDEHMDYAGKPGEGLSLSHGIEIARHLEKLGVDALDVSSGIYETMNTAWEPVGFDEGWKIDGPAAVKKAVSIPVIGVSVIREPAYAEQILSEGKVDLVGSARAFLADPQWGKKALEGRDCEIRKCISCLYCMETLMAADMSPVPMGCAINFEAGREAVWQEAQLPKDGNGRCVAVIGAGPAGMEAARVLALRGFRPVVFEKTAHVGGQVLLGSKPPKKEKTSWLVEYQLGQLEKLGVEIRLNAPATVEALRELQPCAVFVAQGSHSVKPRSIPGLDGADVYVPADVLMGRVNLRDQDVCVVGSGMTGIETAELLGSQGNRVTVFEMADEIGPGVFFQNLMDVMRRVDAYYTKLYPKHKLLKVDGGDVTVETTDTHVQKTFHFDSVVISLGVAPNCELVEELEANFDHVVQIGDANKGGRIADAIAAGYLAAAEL